MGRARGAPVPFAAVVADCFYGPSETGTLVGALGRAGVPYVLALKPHRGIWARIADPHTPIEAARAAGWRSRRRPGSWQRVTRRFRDGHTETWWATDARLGCWGTDGPLRLVVATTDPAGLPEHTTWYLITNRPRPGSPPAAPSPLPPADLAEIVRCYGLRTWVEQGYKQVKNELGWADFQVRSDVAIRRYLTLVCCAFSFSWQTWSDQQLPTPTPETTQAEGSRERGARTGFPAHTTTQLAPGDPRRPRLADPRHRAHTLVAGMVHNAPTR